MQIIFSFLSIFILGFYSLAETEIGIGFSSPYATRSIPSLGLAHDFTNWKAAFFSSGVQSQLYYHSTYNIAIYKTWKAGDFWNYPVEAGFGGGVFYSERGFRDGVSAPLEVDRQTAFGPALQVQWNISHFFVKLECTYGLANILQSGFSSSVQDNALFAVGYRW